MKLLFICSGNTCRSPLALAAWRANAPLVAAQFDGDDGLEQIHVESAGLCADVGERAARNARRIAHEWGASLDAHRSQIFMPHHAEFDLILTMTRDQAEVIRTHFHLDQSRVRLLGLYAPRRAARAEAALIAPLLGRADESDLWLGDGDGSDILDPYGGSMEAYGDCAAHIKNAVCEVARSLAGVR